MKESLIQTAIEQYLRLQENLGRLVYTKNNSGALKTHHGTFIRFGKIGSPDFFVFLPDGKTIHLEVKNETGRLSDNQKHYQALVEKLGHTYLVVRSVNNIENCLNNRK